MIAPLANGPRLVTGKAELKRIQAARDGNDVVVSAEYTGNLRRTGA
jgi:hypothetical protein